MAGQNKTISEQQQITNGTLARVLGKNGRKNKRKMQMKIYEQDARDGRAEQNDFRTATNHEWDSRKGIGQKWQEK